MKSFSKIIILNIIIALIISVTVGALINRNYTNRVNQRLNNTKEIVNLKIQSFINDTTSISESLTTILSNSDNEAFVNKFLKDNHIRYQWIDHIYVIDENKKVIYDSKGKGNIKQDEEHFNNYKFHFPINESSILSSKSNNLKRPDTLLLTNDLNINHKSYTAATVINMRAFKDEIKLITKRFNIEVKGIDGTKFYEVGKQHQQSKEITYMYKDLPVFITISGQYNYITRIILPSIFIFLVIFLLLTILALLYKSRTERMEHEKLIDQANNEKLRLIGTLAANTAHEIKNPLTSINGFIELTRMKYDKDYKDRHFNIITEELDRINNIVTQFLYLGKPTNLTYTNVNIAQVISDVQTFLAYELEQHNINIHLKLPEESIYAYISEDQLKQILINLIQNAKDALEQTTNPAIEIQLQQQSPGQACIIFKDNGMGISKETQEQIFEPFFTTKESGSGLGLYLSKKLIEDWKGHIEVQSHKNEGTTFIITLPLNISKK
ncbi:two-component system sensor histidine kinase NtrB [Mammaliicoccus sp. Dog046]|uniref:two-component system sensor histidine kinase NtrB n=1 Tax=Mammaliicoccus sp. Dog046 TaxID=3034233 RepID=UPI002B25EFF4|nr:ATP-binding protein [Mammaliicoccus sp. Dog046]WQK84809.1 ATP-binding protein [Mammaliicoccus sp. Dog046]